MGLFRKSLRSVLLTSSIVITVIFLHGALKDTKSKATRRFHRSALVNNSLNQDISVPAVSPKHKPTDTFLLVIVNSAANGKGHVDKRNAIRQTWGKNLRSTSPFDWYLVFIVGKTSSPAMDERIQRESDKFGDLLVVTHYDTYRDITNKLLSSLQWASEKKYKYVLKTDDDVYVKLPALIEWLVAKDQMERFYGGVLYEGPVIRDKKHRHYVSEEHLRLNRYPTFCKGSLYVLSWDLVPRMVSLSKKVKRIAPDDAYVGLLANAMFVEPVPIDRFLQLDFLDFFIEIVTDCQLKRMVGLSDSLTPRHIFYLHQRLSSISWTNHHCIHVDGFSLAICVVCVCFVLYCAVCRRLSSCGFF